MISIWEARSDGSDLHPLFPEWHTGKGVCCGRWTADGKYYVFVAVTDIGNVSGDLFALAEQKPLFRKSSREPVRLTFGPLAFAAPLPSLNGKQLFAFGLRQRGEIVRYDSSSKQFVPFLGGISATNVSFSRDGKWIAFVSLPDNHLWRGRADGSDRLQLTFGDSVSELPRWSPDGKQIAYVSSSGGKPWKISMISADGGLPRALFPDSGGESDPTWSPDGKQIAFATDFGGHFHIRVLGLQSGDISSIPAPAEVFSPRWSPDGRYIAALLHDYPYRELFLFDFHTRKWSEWTRDNDGISWPAWTADSRYLQYQTMSGDHMVRRLRIGESSAATLFSAKGLRTIPGSFSSWSDNAHDDSRMFTRDNWGQEIYALDLDFP